MNTLSIIVIGRNEEHHIARCLRSVLTGSESFVDREIIYVDSASTDNTVNIAKRFPIRIIQLRSSWKLSSSAGRYLGFENTHGKYVFFVDGDTIVYKHWLEEAVSFMRNSPDIGGVAGIVHEIAVDEKGNRVGFRRNRYKQSTQILPVNVFGGIALYRRAVLERVRPFNPHVKATPELELSLRIRKAGYGLMRLYIPMAITYAPKRETFGEILRRSRSNLYSMGDTLHYCRRNGLAWPYIKERMGFVFCFAAGVLLSVGILLFALVSRNVALLMGWCAVILFFLGFQAIRKRSIRKVGISLFKRTVILYKTIQSFCTARVREIEEYPTDVIVIK